METWTENPGGDPSKVQNIQGGFPRQIPASQGSNYPIYGNTVECRISHLMMAAENQYHCSFVGKDPTAYCTECDQYCAEVTLSCTGANTQFESFHECLVSQSPARLRNCDFV